MNAKAVLVLLVFISAAFAQTPPPKPLDSASPALLVPSSPLLPVFSPPGGASRTFTVKAPTLGDLKDQASSLKAEGEK